MLTNRALQSDLKDVGFPAADAVVIARALANRPQSPHISEDDLLPAGMLDDLLGDDDEGEGEGGGGAVGAGSDGASDGGGGGGGASLGGRRMLFQRGADDASGGGGGAGPGSGLGGLGSLWGSSWGPLVGQQS